jgi:hypothetical protein
MQLHKYIMLHLYKLSLVANNLGKKSSLHQIYLSYEQAIEQKPEHYVRTEVK